jgi:glutaredoxin
MVSSASNEPPRAAPAAALVTVVESETCHFCDDARRVLTDLAVDFPLVVDTLDIRSETGRQLMALHRAAMSPLILVDGAFFSHGRLPRRKLANLLDQRFDAPTARPTRSGGTHG